MTILKKVYTLVFLRKDNKILLGLKKRGFGVNKWNGFGGKVEPNETILEAAVRELKEESCVDVKASDLQNIAHLEFTFEGDPTMMDVRVFSANVFQGEPKETEEMIPKWFELNALPYNDMWPDDNIWFPLMLSGKLFYGIFNFKGFNTILNYNIQELESMEAFYKIHK
ncbi:oxidized purine nucleoside triphosphate hydrolase [Pieris rapae]|uniref:oxidized purine nucleoside triphosphate hydrolase n=1 Tax=Pieris rapae TaxID=64459 RepID=UPI000B92D5F2|nr:oxidized purine nucleoside triphosphate hydrolase [Pieris rapae]